LFQLMMQLANVFEPEFSKILLCSTSIRQRDARIKMIEETLAHCLIHDPLG